jgi:predicted nucleic acid-binding protein
LSAVVLDCSVAAAWFFADEGDAYARKVAEFLATGTGIVPPLWKLELANALLAGERRRRIARERIDRGLAEVEVLDIREAPDGLRASDLLRLARAWRLTAYDAAYVQLAQRLALPLATLDGAMRAAARAGGVRLFD